jgi:hypothetical protein
MLPKLLLLKQKRQRQVKMENIIGLKHHAATVLKSLIIELVEKKYSKHRGTVQKK